MESGATPERNPKRAKADNDCEGPIAEVKKKPTTIKDLPPEIILMIWEAAIDLPPAIVYVVAKLERRNTPTPPAAVAAGPPGALQPDRHIEITKPQNCDFARWRWAQKMGKEFHYARKAVEKTFGTRRECLQDPLRSARAKDLVVYRFPGYSYQNYSWDRTIDKRHLQRHMTRGISIVGVVWDRMLSNGFLCSSNRHAWGAGFCPRHLALFLGHFRALDTVYVQIMLDLKTTKARRMDGVKSRMRQLLDLARDTEGMAIFEDSDRTWVEVPESHGLHLFDDSTAGVYRVLNTTKSWYLQFATANNMAKRKQVTFKVLAASYWKKL